MTLDKNGVIGTGIFHTIVLALLLFLRIIKPEPQGEFGLIIDYGSTDFGSGLIEPQESESISDEEYVAPPQVTEASASNETSEEIITQNFEDAPTIDNSIEKKKQEEEERKRKKELERIRKQKELERKQREEQQKADARKNLAKNLLSGKNNQASTDGQGNSGKTGNEGVPEGSVGFGSDGSGASWILTGRGNLRLEKPNLNQQKQGKVVVEIRVNRNGDVTDARGGVKGSTTQDSYLVKIAEEAAKKSKFTRKDDATPSQIGTITYHFKLQ